MMLLRFRSRFPGSFIPLRSMVGGAADEFKEISISETSGGSISETSGGGGTDGKGGDDKFNAQSKEISETSGGSISETSGGGGADDNGGDNGADDKFKGVDLLYPNYLESFKKCCGQKVLLGGGFDQDVIVIRKRAARKAQKVVLKKIRETDTELDQKKLLEELKFINKELEELKKY